MKKLKSIIVCCAMLLVFIPNMISANVQPYTSGSSNGRSFATTLYSNNSQFTAYTYSSNANESCNVYVEANYKVNGVSKQSIWNKNEDPSTGYAMVYLATVPSTADGNKWTSVYSTHKVYGNGTYTYYSHDY